MNAYLDRLTDEWHDAVPTQSAYDGPSCVLWWTLRLADELQEGGHAEAAEWLRGRVEGVKARRDTAGTYGVEADNLAA